MRHTGRQRGRRSTAAGEHRAVMLREVLGVLEPRPGHVIVDATVGWGGHAVEIARAVGPTGLVIGIDFDPDNLPKARERLEATGTPFRLHQGNFAGVVGVLAEAGAGVVDGLVADLGISSMQIDDAGRGFSYAREGPLDMRMDRSRGRTAAEVLATIGEGELAKALAEFGDEPEAEAIARAVVAARGVRPLATTADLARLVRETVEGAAAEQPWRLHPAPGQWHLHPAARTFQAVRILVNRELANLQQLLRVLPDVLRPGARAAVISFHSGEDRLVKAAFRDGHRAGVYARVSGDPLRPTGDEKFDNPRSRSAKLRWAERA